MPVLDTIKKSLRRDTERTRTCRCRECRADFSLADTDDAVDVECPYCGSADVQLRD